MAPPAHKVGLDVLEDPKTNPTWHGVMPPAALGIPWGVPTGHSAFQYGEAVE